MFEFFSGSEDAPSIDSGICYIAEGRPGFYRLEPIDSVIGDDRNEAGRGMFRLHVPGQSWGCLTACSSSDFESFDDMARSTSTGELSVYRYRYGKQIPPNFPFIGGRSNTFHDQGGWVVKRSSLYGTLSVQ